MRLKKLFSDSLLYGIPKYLGYLSAILLTPIYLRIFSKAEYGAQDVFQTWNNFVIMIIPLGLINSVERYYIEKNISKKKLIGTAMSILLINCTIYILSIICFKNFFLKGFLGEIKHVDVFYLSLALVVLTVVSDCFLSVLKIQIRSKQYAFITITNFLILTVLGFTLVYFYHYGIEGFFYAGIISLMFNNVMSIYYLRNELSITYDKDIVKLLFTFGIHYLLVSVVFQVFNVTDRYLISHYLSLDDVGIFSLGYRLSNFTQFFITPFTLAWLPHAYRLKDHESAESTFIKVSQIYVLICAILLSTICLFRKELIFYFSKEYSDAYVSIGILAFLNFVMGLSYFWALGIPFKNKTIIYSYIAPISALLNFIASWIGVRLIGINGIALGSLIGGVFWIAALNYFSQKLYKINFNYTSYLPLLMFPVFFFFFSDKFDVLSTSMLVTIAIKVLAITITSTALLYFSGSWKTIIEYVKQRRN